MALLSIENIILGVSRLLLEIGSVLILAGSIAGLLMLCLTWRPTSNKAKKLAQRRAELERSVAVSVAQSPAATHKEAS